MSVFFNSVCIDIRLCQIGIFLFLKVGKGKAFEGISKGFKLKRFLVYFVSLLYELMTHLAIALRTTLSFLPHFDVICERLLNRHMAM